ncbi:MAG: flagellar hook-length control protein FliK, partial [Ignavibacteria bacterium]
EKTTATSQKIFRMEDWKDGSQEIKGNKPESNNNVMPGKMVKESGTSNNSQMSQHRDNHKAETIIDGNKVQDITQPNKHDSLFMHHLNEIGKTSNVNEIIKDKNLPMPEPVELKFIQFKDTHVEITKLLSDAQTKSIELKLNPRELGGIKILMDVTNNVVNARLDVENEHVKQLVTQNLAQLKDSLQQQGMVLNQFNINYRNNGQKSRAKESNYSSKRLKINNIEEGTDISDVRPVEKDLGYNSFDYLA